MIKKNKANNDQYTKVIIIRCLHGGKAIRCHNRGIYYRVRNDGEIRYIYSNPGLGQVTITSMEDESFHCFQPNYLGGRKQYIIILSPSTLMHDGKRQKNVKHSVFKEQKRGGRELLLATIVS